MTLAYCWRGRRSLDSGQSPTFRRCHDKYLCVMVATLGVWKQYQLRCPIIYISGFQSSSSHLFLEPHFVRVLLAPQSLMQSAITIMRCVPQFLFEAPLCLAFVD